MRKLKSLLRFCAPISANSLEGQRRYQVRALRSLAWIIVVSVLISGPLDVLFGLTDMKSVALNVLISVPVWWGMARLCQSPDAQRRSEWLAFAMGFLILLQIALTPWLTPELPPRYIGLMLLVPLLMAALTVMRPLSVMVLGAIGISGNLITHQLMTQTWGPDPHMTITLGTLLGWVGAVSSQLTRRVWREREELIQTLQASERMRHLGVLSAGIAHELKTPLAAVDAALLTQVELLDELDESIGHPDITPDDMRDIGAELSESLALAQRGNRKIAGFVDAIRQQTQGLSSRGQTQHFQVGDAIQAALMLTSHRLKRAGIRVDTEGLWPNLPIHGDPGRLEQVVVNLVENAIDAMESVRRRGTIRIFSRPDEKGPCVIFEDEGPGIPENLRDTVFNYMFSTKPPNKGTGLGLTICRDIIEGDFRGQMQCGERPDGKPGARFSLQLRDATAPRPSVQYIARAGIERPFAL